MQLPPFPDWINVILDEPSLKHFLHGSPIYVCSPNEWWSKSTLSSLDKWTVTLPYCQSQGWLKYCLHLSSVSLFKTLINGIGLIIRSSGCSFREARFNPQHPFDCSQLSVTAVPGNLHPLLASSGLRHTREHRHTFKQNSHTHFKSRILY